MLLHPFQLEPHESGNANRSPCSVCPYLVLSAQKVQRVKNFARAIRDSLHHWPTLVVATLCSMGVAALWSANIGALWPVIETALNGKSAQVWLQERVDASKVRVEALQAEIRQETPRPPDRPSKAQRNLVKEERYLAWSLTALEWSNRLLPQSPFHTICVIMAVLVVSTMVKHLLMFANEYLIGFVSTSIVRKIRMRIFDQALRFDRKTFQGYGTSHLLATITHTAEGLSNGLINFFGSAIREPLRIIACLIGAAWICWRLLLLSLILAPMFVFVVLWFNRRVKSIAASILHRNAGFHEVILEALSNIFTVQAYTMEDKERERFAGSTKDMQRCSLKMILYSGLSKPFTELIGVAMIAVTICAGSYLIINKQTHIFDVRICDTPLEISQLLIFFGFLVGASDPLRKLSGVFTSIYTGVMAAQNIYTILDHSEKVIDPIAPKTMPEPHSEIHLDRVSFHYDPNFPVLQEIDLSIPYGKTVAIIGSNGSGKSTLIHLLCRFYDPTSGAIRIDGIDCREFSVQDMRRRVALVSQHAELFNRSVLENIRYGRPEATVEEVEQAARAAHAHDFICNSLSNGYDTIVGQGGQRLSGGQRQRIALARALLRKPEILILDESTSQIDMQSEIQIRESLAEIKGSCTILIITHRVALLELADEIFEMKNGELHVAGMASIMAA